MAQFVIDGTTGALSFRTAPDFEEPADVASTDPVNEAGNNVYVLVVTATGGTGSRASTAVQTITVTVGDVDEALVTVSVADARVEEADGATLDFVVTLDRAASGPVTVEYATADGSARSGDDYTAASGTLTFAAGEMSKTVAVTVIDDSLDEGEETLTLTLSDADPSGATYRETGWRPAPS